MHDTGFDTGTDFLNPEYTAPREPALPPIIGLTKPEGCVIFQQHFMLQTLTGR